ncbi:hypothetical protein [Oceanobacillus oncorhynchi]|nr:hypothetical protein [Oceanobacillus oncorhynchi]MDM8100240.1 hypothetical protein [Oceanobacillus oncorhynchi]
MPAESDFPERTSLRREYRCFKDQAVFLVFLSEKTATAAILLPAVIEPD